jgi:hypothetical protein
MQLGPDLGTGTKHQQANGLAAVAQCHDEQSRAPVLASEWVADHRASAVVDLAFFARSGLDDGAGFRRAAGAQLTDEALDTLVAAAEAAAVHQVLPDRHSVAATRKAEFDRIPEGRASAGGGTATGRRSWRRDGPADAQLRAIVGDHLIGRFCRPQVGNHLLGRFWRCAPPPSGWPHRDSCGSEVCPNGLAPDVCGLFNAPHRPSQTP